MISFDYFVKDLNNICKIGIVLLLSVIWPLAIAFIYLTNTDFFNTTDVIKLTLLGAAFTSPLVLINTLVLYFVIQPLNPILREKQSVKDPIGSAFLFSIIFTALIFITGDIVALFSVKNSNAAVSTVIGLEILLILLLLSTILKERR